MVILDGRVVDFSPKFSPSPMPIPKVMILTSAIRSTTEP